MSNGCYTSQIRIIKTQDSRDVIDHFQFYCFHVLIVFVYMLIEFSNEGWISSDNNGIRRHIDSRIVNLFFPMYILYIEWIDALIS